MRATVSALTVPAVAVKLAIVVPAGTATLAGMLSAALSLLSVTVSSEGGALVNVTVHAVVDPPGREDTSHRRLVGLGACTVIERVFVIPLSVPEMTTSWLTLDAAAVMVKLALVFPGSTVTDDAETASMLGSPLAIVTVVAADAALFKFA